MNNLVYFDGTEVKMGETGQVSDGEKVVSFEVTPDTISKLVKLGILKQIKPIKGLNEGLGKKINDRMSEVNMDIAAYHEILVKKLIEKTGLSKTSCERAVVGIKLVNKTGYFSLLLKEVAIELDKSYKNHISKCKTLFTISSKDGKPYYIKEGDLKCTDTVALFRTEVDAIVACKILASLKKEIFSGRK